MKTIKINKWDNFLDEFNAFMLGMDDAIEKTIIRYLYSKGTWVSFKEIKEFSIDQTMICFNQATLSRRLTSLVNFSIIERRIEHDNKTYYKLDDKFIKELQEKKENTY
jgi:DNA-binding HxlR family transcriptional regulator